MVQSSLFGAAFVAIAACTDMVYVLAAGAAAPALIRVRSLGRYATAAVCFGLSVFTALSDPRPR